MPAVLQAISDLNISPFQAKMAQMSQRVQKFASGDLARMGRTIGGAFSVYAVARFMASVGQAADQLDNVSKATGVGVENLQALNVLFTEGGKSASDVSQVLARLKKSMDEATVDPKIAQSFEKLGISFEDVASRNPAEILQLIARAMRDNAGDMQMGEAAGNLLGRSYAELQGIMNSLASEGLNPLTKRLKETNQIMGEDAVRAADKMQEAYDKLGRQIKTKLGNVLISFAGGLQAAWVAVRTGGDWNAAAESLFGPTEGPGDPMANKAAADARKRSAGHMAAVADRRRNDAVAAANEWYAKAASKISVGSVAAADSLARIGGYIGGQSSPAAAIAERQLKVLELQQQLSEKIAKATESTSVYAKATADALEE